MYPVSEAYKNAISQNERNVRITGTITLKDSSIINISDEDILQGSLYFTEQCVSGEDIEIGNVYASEMGLTLTSPPENPYSLDGARIILNFGIETSEGVWEYVPLGYFYVTEIERKHTAVNLKALDGLILFDVDLSGVLSTGTPYALIESCCNKVGITLATSMEEFQDFSNGLTAFTIPSDSKIETCRDLIMWICQVTGTFARMNRLGQLEIVPVTAGSSVKTISKQERYASDVSDFYVKITQVSMKVGETEYTQGISGMTMALEENPLLTGKSTIQINAALAEILAQVTLAEYTPYSAEFAGDPALQAGDWVTLADTGNGNVASIITHTSWRYRGPHNIKGAGKSGLLRGVQAQQSKTVSSVRAIAKTAQDIAQAANQSTQLINDAITGYVLIRKNETTGSNEILIMDNPDPAQARKVWRWNLGGLGYSDNVTGADNPARQYTVAMTMDGAFNADFVKTGKLSTIELDAVYGTFSDLMAGTPGGARIELGADSGDPFLKMYDGSGLRINQTKEAIEFYHSGTLAAFIKANTVSGYTDLYIDTTRSMNITPRLKLYETHPAYGNMVEHYPSYSEWLNIRQSDLVVLKRGIVGFSDGNFNIDSGVDLLKLRSTGGIKMLGNTSLESSLTVSGLITNENANPIDSARGLDGSYGINATGGSNWGANIWSIGRAYAGSGSGSGFTVGTYGLAWIREGHSLCVDAFSEYGEGLYLFRGSSTPYAVLGRKKAWLPSTDIVGTLFALNLEVYNAGFKADNNGVTIRGDKIIDGSYGTTSSYVRFAGGLQICWGYASRTTAIATQWGYSYHSANWTITFPVQFSHRPAFTGMTYTGGVSAQLIEDGDITTTGATVVFIRPATLASGTRYYSWMAIGRWK